MKNKWKELKYFWDVWKLIAHLLVVNGFWQEIGIFKVILRRFVGVGIL
jgi:hypothetical protein